MDLPEEELVAFLEECQGQLADAESALMSLEDQFDLDQVNLVFRMVHSVKGGAGFFDLDRIKTLAHDLEGALDRVRSGKLEISQPLINALLIGFDRLKEMISQGKHSESMEIEDVLAVLHESMDFGEHGQNTAKSQTSSKLNLSWEEVLKQITTDEGSYKSKWVYALDYRASRGSIPLDLLGTAGKVLGFVHASTDSRDKDAKIVIFATIMEKDLVEVFAEGAACQCMLSADGAVIAVSSETTSSRSTPNAVAANAQSHPNSSEGTLRIPVSILENLMNLAGELVLSRNQLLNSVNNKELAQIQISAQRISQVTSELQETIMQTRMQPLGVLFQRFPRLVRDLAQQLGKNVVIEMLGKDVEVDKAIVEGLTDPLTHMVRNSLDHGLEIASDRIAQGKSAQGTVRLNAWHEAGQVVIELSDDGRGINGDKVAAKALEKGLITRDELNQKTPDECVELIFLPGLSTAEQVSDVSGRGVGMDVVKANIERLGGKVEIRTQQGQGSVFRIRLPLTLAIIPSLLVEASGESFAIPQTSVSELVRVPADQVQKRVYHLGKSQVLDLRGELIPLIRLSDALGLHQNWYDTDLEEWVVDRRSNLADRRSPSLGVISESGVEHITERTDRRKHEAGALQIAVVDAGGFRYGLVVGRLNDTQEIVVKPLELWARESKEYAGATILGNGKIALIIDVSALATLLGISKVIDKILVEKPRSHSTEEMDLPQTAQLLFQSSPGLFCSLPTEPIVRIEPIKESQIEDRLGQKIARIQGKLLCLVHPRDLGLGEFDEHQELVTLVLNHGDEEFGFLASRPLDVVQGEAFGHFDLHLGSHIETTQIVRDRTTLLLDPAQLYQSLINKPNFLLKEGEEDA